MSEIERLEQELAAAKAQDNSHYPEDFEQFYANCSIVAAKKGLPEPDGGLVKFFGKGTITAKTVAGQTESSLKDVGMNKARTKYPRKAEDYHPNEAEMAIINAVSNTDLQPEEIFCFEGSALLNSDVDRSYDVATPKAKSSAARLMADKPIQLNHSHDVRLSVGKTYMAGVKSGNLNMKFYTLNNEANANLNQHILAGIANKMSVSFGMDPADYACSKCNKSMYSMECPHWPGSKDQDGNLVTAVIKDIKDYYETSLVAVPAVPTAGIRRNEMPMGDIVAASFDTDKSLDKNNAVGKIPSEKTNEGDSSVTTENPTAADVIVPVVEETVTAPEVTAPEAKSVDNDAILAALAKFTAAAEAMTEAAKASADALKNNNEVLAAVVNAVNNQSAIVEKAYKTAQDNLSVQAAAVKAVAEQQSAADADDVRNDSLFARMGKAVNPNFSFNK